MQISEYSSPLGAIYIGIEDGFITNLWLNDRPALPEMKILHFIKTWLDDFFSGKDPSKDPSKDPGKNPVSVLPLKLKGTPFQKQVWELLMEIPWGRTITYGEIASRIAALNKKNGMCARAVGQAVGKNPVPIIVPCHRVLGKNCLGGYFYGLEMKKYLLDLEKAVYQYGGSRMKIRKRYGGFACKDASDSSHKANHASPQ